MIQLLDDHSYVRIHDYDRDEIARVIHYPDHWDTINYPTLGDALIEVVAGFQCQCKNDPHPQL